MKRGEISFVHMCKYMYKEGRVRGMWRGNLVNVIKTAPENAIRLATYEKLKLLLHESKEKTFNEKLACGSAAGFVSTLILYPLKTVKTIMNLGKTGEFKSIADCIYKIYETYGVKAFYRGVLANSVAIVPSTGKIAVFFKFINGLNID
jgi:solute carrier family 25 phosphate transporter 23/24/25/41